MVIRHPREEDRARLAAIEAVSWDARATPAPVDPQKLAAQSLDDFLVAELDGSLAGYVLIGRRASFESNRHAMLLRAIAVAPGFRRRGVARALLRAAVELARTRGATKLNLFVLGTNRPALSLYASEGFLEEGRLRGEFMLEGALVDDVILTRFL